MDFPLCTPCFLCVLRVQAVAQKRAATPAETQEGAAWLRKAADRGVTHAQKALEALPAQKDHVAKE